MLEKLKINKDLLEQPACVDIELSWSESDYCIRIIEK